MRTARPPERRRDHKANQGKGGPHQAKLRGIQEKLCGKKKAGSGVSSREKEKRIGERIGEKKGPNQEEAVMI